ncbi:MAG: transposase [Planctomycetota bacterium]
MRYTDLRGPFKRWYVGKFGPNYRPAFARFFERLPADGPDAQRWGACAGAGHTRDTREIAQDVRMPWGRMAREAADEERGGRAELPAGCAAWPDDVREKYLAARAHVRAWDRFVANCNATDPKTWAAFARDSRSAPGRAAGLACDYDSIRGYRLSLQLRKPIDGRALNRGRPRQTVDARLQAAYDEVALHANFQRSKEGKPTVMYAQARRAARDLADELGLDCPSPKIMRADFKLREPLVALHAARGRKHLEETLPKIRREYTAVAPLEWVSGDGHVLNVRAQADDAARTGRIIRPILCGWLCVRTRDLVGSDIRGTENSDGILAATMQMIREHGCPHHYYVDNGAAYKASLGHRVRRQLFADPRIGQLCAETDAERHNALPYQGWAKMIESHWRDVVNGFERYFASWWGNRIDARPEDAAKLPAWKLPTLAGVREAWAEFVRWYRAEPQQGDGMYGLSPALAMEQFRTEARRLDDEVLRFICSRSVGYRLVGRDGVRLDGRVYGQRDEEVWRWQGRRVVVRIDPGDASYVWLYDEKTRDIVIASSERLSGATNEDVREAARYRAKLRRIAKEYCVGRDFLLSTTPQQIMRKKADRAEARQQRVREQLPTPAEPDVTVVRPDLVAPVRKATRAVAHKRARKLAATGTDHSRAQAQADAWELINEPASPAPAGPPEIDQDFWMSELRDSRRADEAAAAEEQYDILADLMRDGEARPRARLSGLRDDRDGKADTSEEGGGDA